MAAAIFNKTILSVVLPGVRVYSAMICTSLNHPIASGNTKDN